MSWEWLGRVTRATGENTPCGLDKGKNIGGLNNNLDDTQRW